ncbi:MAG: hypothetical protein Q9227_005032 [Pyrenula ochraceoflavens]
MPHVREQEYVTPSTHFKLQYVEIIHRHHKRTPYASNTFPYETYAWNCDDEALFFYGVPASDGSSAQVTWQVYISPSNPFPPVGFNGTCQFPQISGGGLQDSRQHGMDLYGVYHDLLGFLPDKVETGQVLYRVTNNVITSQVAGQIVEGQYPSTSNSPVSVAIQPDSIDSLEPTYSCPSADSLYSSYAVGSSNPAWTSHLNASASLYNALDSISGVDPTDAGWHNWFDHYFDNLSSRQCHSKPLPCSPTSNNSCITQSLADAVYRRGLYEYSFIYRDAPQSLSYSVSRYGVYIAELASNLRAAMEPTSNTTRVKYRHNVAHDGSISPLLGILQVDVMVWPGMGAEVVFELYSSDAGRWYVRVLWGGRVLRSSNPSLELMDIVPVETVLAYFDGLVGVNAAKIPGLCKSS